MVVTLDGPASWNLLKGFVCLYKPHHVSLRRVKEIFLANLVEDLNNLSVRPPKSYVKIEGDTTKPLKVSVIDSYADHPLAVGPRYQMEDFKFTWANRLGYKTSGVSIVALNRKSQTFEEDHWNHCIKVYHIKGRLGLMTDNMFIDGKVLYDKVKYEFVRKDHVDKVVSSFQANFQKRMYTQAGVQFGSQEAYDLAVKGPIRPLNLEQPVVYGMQCIEFKPPDFTIEVHCVAEYEEFLIRLIYDLGEKLRTAAVCNGIQCIRNAQFTLVQSLLRKHWRVKHVIENIAQNEKVIQSISEIKPVLQHLNVTAVENNT